MREAVRLILEFIQEAREAHLEIASQETAGRKAFPLVAAPLGLSCHGAFHFLGKKSL